MLEFVTGDLLLADLPAIAHGCNCRGVMGAGVAKAIAHKYPNVKIAYEVACREARFELGGFLCVREGMQAVFNLGTQFDPGRDARLGALQTSVHAMMVTAAGVGIPKIGLPRIGCGIGGLKWDHVEGVLLAECENTPAVTLVVYTLPGDTSWQEIRS